MLFNVPGNHKNDIPMWDFRIRTKILSLFVHICNYIQYTKVMGQRF